MNITEKDVERFWSKVDRRDEDQCWPWLAGMFDTGYGQFWIDGLTRGAHRMSYWLAHGPLNPGHVVDHLCHNRRCVNPKHLRQATYAQNAANRCGPEPGSRSGIRNVTWNKADRKWQVRVAHLGRDYSGGSHDRIEDAEASAIALRARLHGTPNPTKKENSNVH